METLAISENIIQEKKVDLTPDSNSDNTISNEKMDTRSNPNSSVSSNQTLPLPLQNVPQGIIYQQPLTYASSCDELKKLKRDSPQIMNISPSSLQLNSVSNKNTLTKSLIDSPASMSTVTSITTSSSIEPPKEISMKNGNSFILGQPIVLTEGNKKLIDQYSKNKFIHGSVLDMLKEQSAHQLPTPISSTKNSIHQLNLDEEDSSSESETETESESSSLSSSSDDEEVDDHDFSHIVLKGSDEESDEEDDDVDKELTYPMKDGFIPPRDEEEEDLAKQLEATKIEEGEKKSEAGEMTKEKEPKETKESKNKTKTTSKKSKKSKSKKSKSKSKSKGESLEAEEGEKGKENTLENENENIEKGKEPSTEMINTSGETELEFTQTQEPENMEEEEEESLFLLKSKLDKKQNRNSMVSSIDPNSSFYSIANGQGLPSEMMNPLPPTMDPNSSFWLGPGVAPSSISPSVILPPPPPPSQDPSQLYSNMSSTIDPNSSYWSIPGIPPPPPSITPGMDNSQIMVNIQGQKVPMSKIQQVYSFQAQAPNLQNNGSSVAEKLKCMSNSHKLVSFNSREMSTMPHSAKIKINPPILETGSGPKGVSGVPSKSSQLLKAKQNAEAAALKRRSWCNVNSDILGNYGNIPNLQPRQRASFPQLPQLNKSSLNPLPFQGPMVPPSPLVKLQPSNPPFYQNGCNSHGGLRLNLPNPPLINNLPYGTIINTNAHVSHTALNPNARKSFTAAAPKEEKDNGNEKELSPKEFARQRIERWAEESKVTTCHLVTPPNDTAAAANNNGMTTSPNNSSARLKVPAKPMIDMSRKSKSCDNIKQIYTITEYTDDHENDYRDDLENEPEPKAKKPSKSKGKGKSSSKDKIHRHKHSHSHSHGHSHGHSHKHSHKHGRHHRHHAKYYCSSSDDSDSSVSDSESDYSTTSTTSSASASDSSMSSVSSDDDRRQKNKSKSGDGSDRRHHRRHHRHRHRSRSRSESRSRSRSHSRNNIREEDEDDNIPLQQKLLAKANHRHSFGQLSLQPPSSSQKYLSPKLKEYDNGSSGRHTLLVKHSMDSALKNHYYKGARLENGGEYYSRRTSGLSPTSPSLYTNSKNGSMTDLSVLSKQMKRKSYSPGFNSKDYNEFVMNNPNASQLSNYYSNNGTKHSSFYSNYSRQYM